MDTEDTMCRRVECSKCHKPTYAGCGMHVEQVLGDVPPESRCSCMNAPREKPAAETEPFAMLRRLWNG